MLVSQALPAGSALERPFDGPCSALEAHPAARRLRLPCGCELHQHHPPPGPDEPRDATGLLRRLVRWWREPTRDVSEPVSERIAFPAGTSQTIHRCARPLVFRCLAGSIWVTQSGDRDDYVLDPGDVFVGRQARTLTLTTFLPSDVCLAHPVDGAAPPRGAVRQPGPWSP